MSLWNGSGEMDGSGDSCPDQRGSCEDAGERSVDQGPTAAVQPGDEAVLECGSQPCVAVRDETSSAEQKEEKAEDRERREHAGILPGGSAVRSWRGGRWS